MKVQRLCLRNFKRFHDREFYFLDPETRLAEDLIVLVGENGSGKSTVLQAIAAMLGNATAQLPSCAGLDWPGFDLGLSNVNWRRPIGIDMDVEFSQDEIEATREYFSRTEMAKDEDKFPPGESLVVKLHYNHKEDRSEAPTAAEYFQFHGRRYARMILRYVEEGARLFERVGGIFWYTEHRTTNSLTPIESSEGIVEYDMNLVRRRMSDLFNFHERVRRGDYELRPGQRDIFADIERAYQIIFPGHRFVGPVPRTDMEDVLAEPWFYLFNEHSEYELGEMSGGERAIFPMIFDFANWGIHNSVILIDELELHLHPPLQQGLLKALRSLGKNNQFIITTHSNAVVSIVPEESIRRL
jgi:ABC-type branched-subunit amino acid transport system ATPase component